MDIPEVTTTELAELIMRVGRQVRRANADELAGTPLNPHQARALRLVARLEPVRMADLAERLHVAPRSATDVVEVLDAGGWVERSPDPTDGRSRVVRLTETGRGLVAEVDAARARAADRVLGPLAPADRAAVASGLRVVADAAAPGGAT